MKMKTKLDQNPILNALWFGFTIGLPAGMGFTMIFLGAMAAMETMGFTTSVASWYTAGFYFIAGLGVMLGGLALTSWVGRQLLKAEEPDNAEVKS